PSRQMTRQAMAAFIYRLSGSERGVDPSCTGAPFADVPPAHEFCGEIDWMADGGISTGFPDGTYRPGAAVSRQALAAFLYRLAGSPRGDDPACDEAEFAALPPSSPFRGQNDWRGGAGPPPP